MATAYVTTWVHTKEAERTAIAEILPIAMAAREVDGIIQMLTATAFAITTEALAVMSILTATESATTVVHIRKAERTGMAEIQPTTMQARETGKAKISPIAMLAREADGIIRMRTETAYAIITTAVMEQDEETVFNTDATGSIK